MKKVIVKTLLLFSFGIMVVFSASSLIVADNMNKSVASENADNLLSVLQSQILNGRYTPSDYNQLVEISNKDIRLTIIATDGTVIADSDFPDPTVLDNHINRKEVADALNGKTGSDIRASASSNIKYLYQARLVSPDSFEPIVLRVAIPVFTINAYLYGTLLATAIVFVLILVGTILVSRLVAERINKPYVLVREKLNDVLNPEVDALPIVLTKYDDVNVVLQDIDDISNRLNVTLDEYQSEKRKLDLILENIDQGIIALDHEKHIISCNKTAEDYFGFEFYSSVLAETAIKDRAILDNLNQALARKEFISYDYTNQNGLIFEIRFFPVGFGEISLIITAQNVTEIRKISVLKQEFFANAGHELNTPLASIIGYSEMLLIADDNPKITFAETINKEAHRMKLLIEDMLKISELEENREICDASIDLKAVVEQVVRAVMPKAERKNITLSTQLNSCNVFANAEKMAEVVANLVDNAIKYTDVGGQVAVTLLTQNNKAVLTVKDNGIGIPQNALSRVFERFYRVDKSRSKAEGGTGLGLAIVKHICNHYKAPIKIQSKEMDGTEITVELALA